MAGLSLLQGGMKERRAVQVVPRPQFSNCRPLLQLTTGWVAPLTYPTLLCPPGTFTSFTCPDCVQRQRSPYSIDRDLTSTYKQRDVSLKDHEGNTGQ